MVRTSGFAAATLFLAAALAAGCAGPPAPSRAESLAEGEFLCLEGRWNDAIRALRAHLLLFPEDPGGHFYLGRAYLNAESPWLVLAEGELDTALRLFVRQGKTSPTPRFTDEYFEMICHIESSKVYLKQLLFLLDNPVLLPGVSPAMIIERCRKSLDAARAIDPQWPDVLHLEGLLRGFEGMRSAPPARRDNGPASPIENTQAGAEAPARYLDSRSRFFRPDRELL